MPNRRRRAVPLNPAAQIADENIARAIAEIQRLDDQENADRQQVQPQPDGQGLQFVDMVVPDVPARQVMWRGRADENGEWIVEQMAPPVMNDDMEIEEEFRRIRENMRAQVMPPIRRRGVVQWGRNGRPNRALMIAKSLKESDV